MAKLNSFRDVIEDMFYDDIFNELSAYIEDNPDKIDSNSHRIGSPDDATLSDFQVKL